MLVCLHSFKPLRSADALSNLIIKLFSKEW